MKSVFSFLMLAVLALFSVSCTDKDDSPMAGSARVNFYLVDAPGDFDEVWVEVLAVRVKLDHNDDLDDDDLDEDESGWTEIVYEESQSINLLDLTGGTSEFLGTEDFPEGNIDQLRLILGEDNYVVKDGERFDLKTPSAQQSGLKIKVDEDIQGGMNYDLIIDFDVAKSIVVAGNSGNIILKPVLRAFMQESAAGVMGQVLPKDAQPVQVSATGGGEIYDTYVDEDGNYQILGLEDGSYSLTFTPNEDYSPVTVAGIIVDGEITSVEPITLTPVGGDD